MDTERVHKVEWNRRSTDNSHSFDQTLDLASESSVEISSSRPAIATVIFDRRSCLREALHVVLTQLTDRYVIAIQGTDELSALPSRLDAAETTVLYCTVAGEESQTRHDLLSLHDQLPKARLCVLADHPGKDLLVLFDELHLHGVIPSSYGTDQLVACMNVIAAGVPFLPARLDDLNGAERIEQPCADKLRFNDTMTKLTPRQQQVLRHIAVGRSNKYIAAELSLRESTVKVHVSELMKRLGATSRTHAVYLSASLAEPGTGS